MPDMPYQSPLGTGPYPTASEYRQRLMRLARVNPDYRFAAYVGRAIAQAFTFTSVSRRGASVVTAMCWMLIFAAAVMYCFGIKL